MTVSEAQAQPERAPLSEAICDSVRVALARILEAEAVARRPRLGALLQYIVDEELAGRGERLKAFTIAIDVFERDDSFDPQADSIVRVEMFRLRKVLSDYYAEAGDVEDIRIAIPKGTYRPSFTLTDDEAEAVPPPPRLSGLSWPRTIRLRADLAACAAVALFGAGYLLAGVGAQEPEPVAVASGFASTCVVPANYRANGVELPRQWHPPLLFVE